MNIFVSFMNIYDHSSAKRKIIYEHLCFIDDLFWPKNREAKHSKKFLIHWWTFMTKRKKTFMPVYD